MSNRTQNFQSNMILTLSPPLENCIRNNTDHVKTSDSITAVAIKVVKHTSHLNQVPHWAVSRITETKEKEFIFRLAAVSIHTGKTQRKIPIKYA